MNQLSLDFSPHNGTATSIAAATSQAHCKKQRDRDRIVAFVKAQGGATRDELVNLLGMGVGTVCPRVFELLKSGELIEPGEKRATRTGSKAFVLKVKS